MKFFCLKMVIFFCWWQGVAIGLLVKLGQINSAHGHSVQEVADLIQDLLISMEMLVAAIAFFNSFPIMEFANVRQFNWNPLAIAPPTPSSSSSAVQPAVKILESSVHSPKKSLFIPAVGVVIKSTAISSPSHAQNITRSGCNSSNSNNNSNNSGSSSSSSSGSSSSDALLAQSNLESEISRHIMPEISTSLRSQSPVSDSGQSPSVYSSRKVFLPYALPATKSDGKEQNTSHDKKGRPAVGQGQRAALDSDTETGRAVDFTTRLSALRGAGYDLLRGVVPSLIPSSSFAININDSKKRQRHNSPPPNPSPGGEGQEEEEERRRSDSRGALTDNRSDSSPATYSHRGSSYSHEALTPLLIAGQGGRHGEDAGGVSAMGQMTPKGLPSITAHGSGSGLGGMSASSSSQHQYQHQHQHAFENRGPTRGLKGAGADKLPSPLARRRAATAYQTGSINNSIISSANSNTRQLNNTPCKCNMSDTSDDSHTDSHMHTRLQGSSPVPHRHSPPANREVRSPSAHAPTHRGSGRKSVSPDMMEARINVNHSNSSMGAREGALTDSQKAKSSSDTASAQSQPYLRSHSPARVDAKKDMDYCAAHLSSSAFQSTTSLSSSSSASSRSCPNPPSATNDMHYNGGGCFDDHSTAHSSSCIYHTLSRDGARDYARDPLLREERDDLRNERGHFIGSSSSSNNNSGTELFFIMLVLML
jgi:Organic solute transporter Ostalpha